MKKKLTPWELDINAEHLCFDLRGIQKDKVKYNTEINNWIRNHLMNGLCVAHIASSLSMALFQDYDLMIETVNKHKKDLDKQIAANKLIGDAIFSKESKPEYVVHYYKPEEITLIANDLLSGLSIKEIARTRGKQFNRKGPGMLKKIRQIQRSLNKGFTKEQIINKETTETYNKEPEAMKQIKFYTQKEIDEMVSLIKDPTVNMHNVCLQLAKKHGRSHNAVKVKMYQIRRKLETGKELKRIVTIEPKKNVKPESVIEEKQQPADIGVDVPHGMTFEGKPKRITLHSDHFRIYF